MSNNCSDRDSDAYDTDDAEEDDAFSEEEDAHIEEEDTTTWNFISTPEDAPVTIVTGAVDEFLFQTMKDEINVICFRIRTRMNPNNDLLNEVAKLLLNPLIPSWVDACNASLRTDEVPIKHEEMESFITTLSYLSFYQVTPTTFFGEDEAFPPAQECNEANFKRILRGFCQPSSDVVGMQWGRPYPTCKNVSECEVLCNRKNSQLFYIQDVSILSTDDDQYRLASSLCESIGLVRVNNPKKAFGPVATGCVSLTSGITLSVHVARRGETPVDITQILFMNLTDCYLPSQVTGRNIVAMDRGYWSKELIDYLSSSGFQLLGTHKRVGSFPFTFGDTRKHNNQRVVAEEGAKSVYWAKKPCMEGMHLP